MRISKSEYQKLSFKDKIELMKEFTLVYVREHKGYENAQWNQQVRCPCPSHEDNHPSAVIYRKSPSIYCFVCGRKFDILDLVWCFEGEDYDRVGKQLAFLECRYIEGYSDNNRTERSRRYKDDN